MAAFDDWCTDRAVTWREVERFLAARAHIGERFLDRYVVWTSSGTTGTPGVFVQDATALAAYDAMVAMPFVSGTRPALRLDRRGRAGRARGAGDRRLRPLREHRVVAARRARQALARHEELSRDAAACRARVRPQRLRAGVRGELPDGARHARRRAAGRAPRAAAGGAVGRRRGAVARRAPRHRGGVPLSAAQRVRRVRMPDHRLRLPAPVRST